jgi:hypothetical protein
MDVISYALSKRFTTNTADSLGSLKGAPCQVKSIEDNEDGTHTITLSWTGNSGTEETQSFVVSDGKEGKPGSQGERGEQGFPGKDGFAPQVAVEKSTDNEYILRIQDVDSDYDTPNLKGSGGISSSYDEEDENVHIW